MSRFLLLCISLLSAFAVAGEPGVTEKSITIGQSISLEQGKNVYGEVAARAPACISTASMPKAAFMAGKSSSN